MHKIVIAVCLVGLVATVATAATGGERVTWDECFKRLAKAFEPIKVPRQILGFGGAVKKAVKQRFPQLGGKDWSELPDKERSMFMDGYPERSCESFRNDVYAILSTALLPDNCKEILQEDETSVQEDQDVGPVLRALDLCEAFEPHKKGDGVPL